MSLIRCGECKREISSTAVSCPHCGFVLSNGGNSAFERRIEQYSASGYQILKRSDNSIEMFLKGNTFKNYKEGSLKKMLFWGVILVIGILLGGFIMFNTSMLIGALVALINFALSMINIVRLDSKARIVTISLTKTGKLEEHGNVLKKK